MLTSPAFTLLWGQKMVDDTNARTAAVHAKLWGEPVKETEKDRIAAQKKARSADKKRRREVNGYRKKKGQPPLRDDEPTPQFVKKTPEENKKRRTAERKARVARAPVFTCECGHTMKNSNGKAGHLKSDIHLLWMTRNSTTPEERAQIHLTRCTVRFAEREKADVYRIKQRAKIAEENAMMAQEDKTCKQG